MEELVTRLYTRAGRNVENRIGLGLVVNGFVHRRLVMYSSAATTQRSKPRVYGPSNRNGMTRVNGSERNSLLIEGLSENRMLW